MNDVGDRILDELEASGGIFLSYDELFPGFPGGIPDGTRPVDPVDLAGVRKFAAKHDIKLETDPDRPLGLWFRRPRNL